MHGSRRVVIVQRSLRAYRRPFYDQLRPALADRGVELELLHTTPPERTDPATIPTWARRVPGRTVRIGDRQLVWQWFLPHVRGTGLVVVEQAVQLIGNYPLQLWQRLGGPPVAMWGHGRTLHLDGADGGVESVKALLTRGAHWFFAYNELTARFVAELGFPRDRTTVVRNATDTRSLRRAVERVGEAEVAAVRAELGLPGEQVCLFLGNVDDAKRPDFLLAAGVEIHRAVPGFTLVFVGDGAAAERLRRRTAGASWVRWAGARHGSELAVLLRAAHLLLIPAWVGLVVVDGFAAGVPTVASASSPHPPEASYIVDGVNGRMVADGGDPRRYADAVVELLTARQRLDVLRRGAWDAGGEYSIEEMVGRFAEGVDLALAARRR